MTEGSGSSQLVKGAKISPFARFSQEQAHASPPACCQHHRLGGPNAMRLDKLFCEQQARMGNSLMRQEKESQNIPTVVCTRRVGDKGQSVKLERVCWELGVWLVLKT